MLYLVVYNAQCFATSMTSIEFNKKKLNTNFSLFSFKTSTFNSYIITLHIFLKETFLTNSFKKKTHHNQIPVNNKLRRLKNREISCLTLKLKIKVTVTLFFNLTLGHVLIHTHTKYEGTGI